MLYRVLCRVPYEGLSDNVWPRDDEECPPDIPFRCSEAVLCTLGSAFVGMLEELCERLISDVLPGFPLASSLPKLLEAFDLPFSTTVPPPAAPLGRDVLDKVLLPPSSALSFPESPSLDFLESFLKKLPLKKDSRPSWFLGGSAFLAFECPSLKLRFSLSALSLLVLPKVPS